MNQNDSYSETQNLNQSEEKRITLSVRVRPDEYERLKQIARAEESSVARILRLAVVRFLEEWESANRDTG